ncbi:porphobilinogen deaminase-like [Teratosphaeria destructans]|uniref:Porphobilinogen deaminase n=1 Tax=Teratosphaeria destructans TaxID=418781 RepID=A0A9W7SU14_9PEZI|nr:porphobilinogen deaminase-like [Teratosphaeria destructans]
MAGLQDAPMVTETHTETSVPASADAANTFHVGTRQSILARVQADEVVKSLRRAWPDKKFEIHAMSTTGDNNQKTALHKFNEKALWTQELEVLLQKGELDLIVHCLKDMPTQLPIDLTLGCITKREDPRDALVIKPSLADKYKSLAELPEGSVIGTSSLRRSAQLKKQYKHLKFADVRGNIGTRLSKLDNPEGEYSAIILAVAGLARLGMNSRITTYLSTSNGGMLHAVGQGALGIEIRKDDKRTEELLAKISDDRTTKAALAERQLMRTLEGGCSVPIGVETQWVSRKGILDTDVGVGIKPAEDYNKVSAIASTDLGGVTAEEEHDDLTDELIFRAIVCSLDGQDSAEVESRRRITSVEEANEFGFDVAKLLVQKGADKILEQVQLNRGIIHKQGDA